MNAELTGSPLVTTRSARSSISTNPWCPTERRVRPMASIMGTLASSSVPRIRATRAVPNERTMGPTLGTPSRTRSSTRLPGGVLIQASSPHTATANAGTAAHQYPSISPERNTRNCVDAGSGVSSVSKSPENLGSTTPSIRNSTAMHTVVSRIGYIIAAITLARTWAWRRVRIARRWSILSN